MKIYGEERKIESKERKKESLTNDLLMAEKCSKNESLPFRMWKQLCHQSVNGPLLVSVLAYEFIHTFTVYETYKKPKHKPIRGQKGSFLEESYSLEN